MADDGSTEREIMFYLWAIVSPILITFGTIGNILCIAVLSRKSMRSSSAAVYLTVLAVADTIVLITGLLRHFIVQVAGIDVRHISELGCKLHSWLLYTFMDISVWTLVAFTFERILSVYSPHRVKSYCNRMSSFLIVLGIMIIMMTITGHMIFGFGDVIKQDNNNQSILSKCQFVSQDYTYFFEYTWAWIDFSVYSLIPMCILIIGNSFIAIRVLMRRRKTTQIMRATPEAGGESVATIDLDRRRVQVKSARSHKISAMTILLLLLNLIFLVTTFPVSLFAIIKPKWDEIGPINRDAVLLYLTFATVSLINYINHSINFILYCITGSRFRTELIKMFTKQRPWMLPENEEYSQDE